MNVCAKNNRHFDRASGSVRGGDGNIPTYSAAGATWLIPLTQVVYI